VVHLTLTFKSEGRSWSNGVASFVSGIGGREVADRATLCYLSGMRVEKLKYIIWAAAWWVVIRFAW
jgi:hypothetical protein